MSAAVAARPTVIVISDDNELGGLLALNLRRRRLCVEHTDFTLASSSSWSPSAGRPAVVVVNVEKTSTDPLAFLRVARARPWLREVPIILAADDSAAVIVKLGGDGRILPTKLDDIGAIVRATLRMVRASTDSSPSTNLVPELVEYPEGEDTMTNQEAIQADVIDLNDVPMERRTERLERAFRLISPGEVIWIAGTGDTHHYERFLHQRFPGEVDWIADHDLEGRWIARVDRR